jgi:hypothetical protein
LGRYTECEPSDSFAPLSQHPPGRNSRLRGGHDRLLIFHRYERDQDPPGPDPRRRNGFARFPLGATQWVAWRLAFQPQLGHPWFNILGWPVYDPPSLVLMVVRKRCLCAPDLRRGRLYRRIWWDCRRRRRDCDVRMACPRDEEGRHLRRVVAIFADQHLGKQRRRRQAAGNRPLWRCRLADRAASPARVFGPDSHDTQLGSHPVQHLADALADATQGPATARACVAGNIQNHIFTRQMLGQWPALGLRPRRSIRQPLPSRRRAIRLPPNRC